mmetsp:Transcript_47740/g.121030  ORF Transcript_47740/g.121030 Transcript_47740/m.121030 type:complete len:321 (-) Transcript_47740:76-1038(-)
MSQVPAVAMMPLKLPLPNTKISFEDIVGKLKALPLQTKPSTAGPSRKVAAAGVTGGASSTAASSSRLKAKTLGSSPPSKPYSAFLAAAAAEKLAKPASAAPSRKVASAVVAVGAKGLVATPPRRSSSSGSPSSASPAAAAAASAQLAAATVRLAITSKTKDRNGRELPEVRWLVAGKQCVWEVLRRWAVEVLKIPELKLPGGPSCYAATMEKKGVAAVGCDGKLPMMARLSEVASKLPIKGGHRLLTVEWPATALPAEWRRKPKKASDSTGDCADCGGSVEFRKCDGGMRTLAVCMQCEAVKGSHRCGPGGRRRSRSPRR